MTLRVTSTFFRSRTAKLALALTCAGLCTLSADAATTHLYASPTGLDTYDCSSAANACSLTRARDRVRALNANMSGDIVVNLASGTYPLKSTFQLNQLDSGNNGFSVIYQGPATNGTPAMLSGGMNITGWTLHDSGKNIWKATLPSSVDFRQLYVNGTRAIRARWPNATNEATGEPYLRAVSTVSKVNGVDTLRFVVRSTDFKVPNNLLNTEVVWLNHWKHLRARMASFTVNTPAAQQTTINFQSPEKSNPVFVHYPQDRSPFYYENALSMLDAPGEWFLDTTRSPRVLYYIPRTGENISQAQVIAPQTQTLLELAGTNSSGIHHVQIRNRSFAHSNWNLPATVGYGTYQGADINATNGVLVPAAISIKNADTVTLENNLVTATGAHAVMFTGNVSNYRVVHNQLSDLSAGGVYDEASSNNGLIASNLIDKVGRSYTDATGILVRTMDNNTIEYNEVRFAPYTGISQGYFPQDRSNLVYRVGNRIQYNHIHHVLQVQVDGGGIYTLGTSTNNTVQYNYVHDIGIPSLYGCVQSAQTCALNNGLYPPIGIYLDESSSGRRVNNNVLNNTFTTFKINTADPFTRDNIITANHHNNSEIGAASDALNTVSDNVYVSPGSAWPQAATSVMNAAGSGAGRY